ncbi:MAG: ABC transporter ATP-binding protein, partial [Endomicrobium sp.]|nr:ABC transporter ATP-binding protein [Endomicrobium sp.]
NTGYALRVKGLPKEEIRAAVADALSKVRLDGFQKRMPSELSGGQSQRVAIARAIIGRPKILLLDEPLGALDLQLRRAMQAELKSLQKTLGITFIYITHDQEEALNMSDRVAVMRNGLFEQIGAVSDIYDFPKTAYVANFVGNANVLTGKIYSVEGDKITVSYPGGYFTALKRENENIKEGEEISASVRSEYVNIVPYYENHPKESVIATVRNKSFAGGLLHITAVLPDSKEVTASRSGINSSLEIGETAAVFWDYKRAFTVKGRLYESF